MELIRDFKNLNKNDAGLAGGKGASLGEMTEAGIPVPPGFVVLTEAFEYFIKETDLVQEIEAILGKVNHKEIHTVEAAAEKIKALILSRDMPDEVAHDIKKHFAKLRAKYVAVRSSATAEDGQDHAWAGQLDSYLNTTETDLLDKVKRCWASLFTPRAIFYRFEKGLHKTKISVAVVVQKMVESEVSGIAFSVHPVTEDRNQLIIEAGFGLGEAIVSGSITPDSYVVEKVPRKIIDINISTQNRALYRVKGAKAGGNEWCDISEPKASSQVLNEAQILELSEIILKIEEHYGFPCDIEWAYEAGRFYIVQSRPITTLSTKGDKVKNTDSSIIKTIKTDSKIEFKKSYSRDTTLFMQGLWARGIVTLPKEKFGWDNPHLPFIVHYVNDGVVEIWEHKKAISWFLDRLYKENLSNPTFLSNLFKDYIVLLSQIKKIHENDISSPNDIKTYTNLIYQAAFIMTIFFYTGIDERNSKDSQDIAVQARKEGDFFADNDVFVRRNIAKLGGFSEELAGVVLFNEIENLPTVEILTERLHSFLIIDGTNPYLGEIEDFALVNPRYVFDGLSHIGDVSEVKGQIAFPGIIRGIVRIVKKQSHMNEVKIGDILVSPMTTPDFLPAMKIAGAFVTDEGGVTCHAAIVSREMKKPCIIGTKIATKILKNDDLVEVDANLGIVKILK